MRFKVTSVFRMDFHAKSQNWDTTDPELFGAPTVKNESSLEDPVHKHLRQEARDCDFLVLWFDFDMEGENLCLKVMDSVVLMMKNREEQQVFRARFSSIRKKGIDDAMRSLVEPKKNEASAVRARQEIYLKAEEAFTNFRERIFRGESGNFDSSVILYGPCQTPTLAFCVERHLSIINFSPETFWVVCPSITKNGKVLQLEWDHSRVFDQDIATVCQEMMRNARFLKVTAVVKKDGRIARPKGLNCVEMLKGASSILGKSPDQAMDIAEKLYTLGYISYPFTEATVYPAGFDFKEPWRCLETIRWGGLLLLL